RVGQRLHLRFHGDVSRLNQRAAAERLDLRGQRLERRGLARGEGEVRALARQREADLAAHTFRGAGDDRHAPLHAAHPRYPSRTSAATRSASRSIGGPYPPPPHVSTSTRSPRRSVSVCLPDTSRSPSDERSVTRNGAPSSPPASPHGGITRRSNIVVSVTSSPRTRYA